MKLNVHLISDSTGLTVESVAKSSIAQFQIIEPIYHNHHFIQNQNKLKATLDSIQDNPGIIFSTLAQPQLEEILQKKCDELKVPLIPVLDFSVKKIMDYTGITECNWGREVPIFGIQHFLTPEYEKRMNAIDFAIQHDDGQNIKTIFEGDIILLGVSRTSKTPTSIFLSNKGYKTGNIPLIPNCNLDEKLLKFLVNPARKKPIAVGLTISPERLAEIRINRIKDLDPKSVNDSNSYINLESIKQELLEFRRFFAAYNITVIDATRRSIEEIASRIIELI